MRIINFDSVNINILDTEDDRLPHGVEEVFSPQDFKDYFGLDYGDYVQIVYEPYRDLYIAEKKNSMGGNLYEDPNEEPLLKKIKEKEQEIMDYIVLRHLKKELPSKFHRIENYKVVLPKAHEETYAAEVAEKESWNILQDTQWYALREMETGIPQPEEVRAIRMESYDKLTEGFVMHKLGLKTSSGVAVLAGAKKNKTLKDKSPAQLKAKHPENK